MKLPTAKSATTEHLMLWIVHRFADEFSEHAVLKGGMQLALLSSERQTNDIDYIFVPFDSKNEVVQRIEKVLGELEGAIVEKSMHSTSGRFVIKIGKASTQIEFSVDLDIPSTSLSTQRLAARLGSLPQLVRVMLPEVALSHKIAAWNEQRLLRDLYDIYYWYGVLGVEPDQNVFDTRLKKINSRLPRLKATKTMTRPEFCLELENAMADLTEDLYYKQLSTLVSESALRGTFSLCRASVRELASHLAQD